MLQMFLVTLCVIRFPSHPFLLRLSQRVDFADDGIITTGRHSVVIVRVGEGKDSLVDLIFTLYQLIASTIPHRKDHRSMAFVVCNLESNIINRFVDRKGKHVLS